MMRGVSKLVSRALRQGSCAARKGVICSADFIKCAGDGKPDFIKCGLGDACHFEMVEVA